MSKAQKIINGLLILNKYPDMSICPAHDQLYAGPQSGAVISDIDKRDLTDLGWFEDEGGWSIFT